MRRQLDVTANNLANVSTNGFKRDELAFNDLFAKQLDNGTGAIGFGPTGFSEFTAFNDVGELRPTGNSLDLAIDGPKGAFALRTSQGTIAYTRDGSFDRDSEGYLISRNGDRVLDDSMSEIQLGQGTITVTQSGAVMVNGEEVATIGVFDGQFTKSGQNRYTGTGSAIDDVRIKSGHLEGSNVNAIEAMTSMITLNRSFEIAQRSITAQDELAQRLIQSMNGQ